MKLTDKPVTDMIAEGHRIDAALREAARRTLLEHKLLGQPVVVWKDGKTVWLSADEIVVPPVEPEFADEPVQLSGEPA